MPKFAYWAHSPRPTSVCRSEAREHQKYIFGSVCLECIMLVFQSQSNYKSQNFLCSYITFWSIEIPSCVRAFYFVTQIDLFVCRFSTSPSSARCVYFVRSAVVRFWAISLIYYACVAYLHVIIPNRLWCPGDLRSAFTFPNGDASDNMCVMCVCVSVGEPVERFAHLTSGSTVILMPPEPMRIHCCGLVLVVVGASTASMLLEFWYVAITVLCWPLLNALTTLSVTVFAGRHSWVTAESACKREREGRVTNTDLNQS